MGTLDPHIPGNIGTRVQKMGTRGQGMTDMMAFQVDRPCSFVLALNCRSTCWIWTNTFVGIPVETET